jgi:uncharacterized repeat protein (TIGR03803 family)
MNAKMRALCAACLVLAFAGCSGGGQFATTPALGVGQSGERNASASARGSAGYHVLYDFQAGSDGAQPLAGMIADKSGNLYGAAMNYGGAGECNVHCGSIFELTPPTGNGGRWKFVVLYSFTGGKDGGLPGGNVIFGPDGSLYGTTVVGGAHPPFGKGVVFQLKPSGSHWTESVLHRFGSGTDGENPHGGLVADKYGNLYGTTTFGGGFRECDGACGSVYELSPAAKPGGTWKETVLYRFSGGEDGFYPLAGLVIDRTGRLYGTTEFGGYFSSYCQGGCGTVFEISPPSVPGNPWNFAVIHQFAGGIPGDGALPEDPLIFDRAGNLYGTTFVSQWMGGGTAFELSPPRPSQPWTETVLYRFPESKNDAGNPIDGFIFDRAGNLYATSQEGGPRYQGTVFKLIPPAMPGDAWTDSVLYSFISAKHGATYPAANLVFGRGGVLYGTTQYGGTGSCVFTKIKGCGTVFEVNP